MWLVEEFDGSTAAAIWGPTSHTIRYACKAFDSLYGAARTSSLMVHENFHGISPSHTACHLGSTSCGEWNFDTPVVPLRYNVLSELSDVDSYQLENRYLCDLTEEPAAWIPDQARLVINQRANARLDDARFTNMQSVMDPLTEDAGPAPIQCGLPTRF